MGSDAPPPPLAPLSSPLLAAATLPVPAHHSSGGLATIAIVLAALAGALILISIAWSLVRAWAWEPRWMLSMRHSVAEAGYRASATWSEFADWARLGR